MARHRTLLGATAILAILFSLSLSGCRKLHHADLSPLDQAGMSSESVAELRQLEVTDPEVRQLALARQGGISDQTCVVFVRIAREHPEMFPDGQTVASLRGAGFAESSIVELARLNQLGLWAGEAQAMRLANLPDDVVLAVARRRAAGQPVLSSPKVADLRNVGLSDKELIADIENGTTDEQADRIVILKNYAAGGHSFVPQRGRRR